MPVIENSTYKAPAYLLTSHLQTILPALFRKVGNIHYTRERIYTPDNDFLDLDWSNIGSDTLAIISHGLEGSSSRPYVLGMVKSLNMNGWDTLAWNYRGCGGEMNKQDRLYHSGDTIDLDYVIQHVTSLNKYKNIFLIGFSLGGNIVLKYLGERGSKVDELVKCAVTFSVPCHLESGAYHLAKVQSKIYMQNFLRSLYKKFKEKEALWPEKFSTKDFHKIKNFLEFDNRYTAPIHGFENAYDYWTKSSSIHYLENISIPSLIITAKNDPFMAPECYPVKEAANSKYVFLEMPEQGGHCGFFTPENEGIYWSEKRAIEFINNSV